MPTADSWPEACKPLEELIAAGQVKEPSGKVPSLTPDLDTEKAFQKAVDHEASRRGWKHYHTYDSRKSAAGFPDSIIVRNGWLIVAELKVGDNKLDAAQLTWKEFFEEVAAANPQVIYRVWYPEDWPTIIAMLDNPDAEKPR